MIRLFGRAISGGSAIGTAAVVRWNGVVPQLPARLLEEMARAARSGHAEPIEVVIVAEDAGRAAALALQGVRVVGIVAESPAAPEISATYPILIGVDQATSHVSDDMLVVVDGDRGFALVDPDGTTVAAFQAERERIAPRRRIYIDYAHEVARTLDGRPVRVLGLASDPDQVGLAAEAGADGIVLLWSAIEGATDDEEQREQLCELFRAAGGKPVTLIAGLDEISPQALLRAAVWADVTLAVPLPMAADSLDDYRAYMDETGKELSGADLDWRPLQLAVAVDPRANVADTAIGLGAHRLALLLNDAVEGSAGPIEALETWILAAEQSMTPVEAILPLGSLAALEIIVALGASAVAVAPHDIASAKDRIRNLDAAAARPVPRVP